MWSEKEMKFRTLICFILSFTTLCCGYVITTPRRWTAGEESQVCIILSAPATSQETINFEMKEESSYFSDLVMKTNIVVPKGTQSICQEVALPLTQANQGVFTIDGSLEGQTLNYTNPVKIVTDAFETFVQTDKYLYKPSQTVQFRILTVTGPFLQVSTEAYQEIWVESPSGTRLAQWLHVANEKGLIHLSFQLPDEPEEGEYKIKVRSTTGKNFKRSFKVEEYVLPRFEVTINPPKYILGSTEIITFEVCAKYTFGQPVKGNVTLSVNSNNYLKFYYAAIKRDKIFGCHIFNISADELYINGYRYANYLETTATITEEGTGVEIKATNVRVEISRTVITFKDISAQKYYKPELPYVGKIQATFPDGKSAPNEVMEICCRKLCKNISTNVDGILPFAIPPHLAYDIRIKAPGYPKIKDGDSGRKIMRKSKFRKSLTKYHSPSNSSLVISLPNKLECTSRIEMIYFELPVMFAVNKQESASITVQVVSRGQIQFSKTFDQSFKSSTNLPFPESWFIELMREPSTPGLVRGYFTVDISLPKTVSPEAQILVWYARDDGEVVSDTSVISITECLLNSVDITWSTDKVQPGANAALSITAEPFSLCSLGVVDKSVQLLSYNNKNSLTSKKLLGLTKRVSVDSNDHQQFDIEKYCRKSRVHKRSFYNEFFSDEVDASSIFNEAGVYVLSNLTLETRPCRHQEGIGGYYHPIGELDSQNIFPRFRNYPSKPFEDNSISIPNVEKKRKSFKKARTYFPETWIWTLVTVWSNGSYEEDLTLPDTVTEWVGSAVCVHPSKGVGISNTASIITFKEFFVDLTLPPSVKRGEVFPVKISIFNYLNESLPIRLILKSIDDQFDILANTGSKGGSGVRTACVPVSDKTVLSIRIRAKEVGDVNISVNAIVQENAVDDCDSGNVQQRTDFMVKPIRVSFEGVLKEETQSKYVCSNENSEEHLETWNVTVPDSIVPDSARGFVAVVGDLMGPTVQNLGKLIRMPYGCGEQNMLNFAPNIFVMQYLEASNESTANFANKAIEFMEKGYNRELTYRHRDGSFSAFGKGDKSGSTWLTAFVLKCFAQARSYIKINVNDLSVSKEWLKSKQLKNGCFESVGKVLNKGMKGGLSGSESPSLLTAFVAIALIEAGESVNSKFIGGALFCIKSAAPTTNPYSLAVQTYALALAKSTNTQTTLDQLLNLATTADDTMYWQLPVNYESSKGAAVETASYAVLALLTLASNSSHLPKVLSIVKWINTQRNGQGGFITTQDTIIALQALASFEKTFFQGPVDLTVMTTIGNDEGVFSITKKNKLLQQSVTIRSVPTSIRFHIVGQGCILLQSVLRYNKPEAEANEAFSLRGTTTTEPDKGCKTKRIEVCASYLLPDHISNMAIIEIDLVSGYIPEKEDLKQIIANGKDLFKLYEVDGSTVMFYVDEFSSEEICLSFRILREVDVENSKPGTVKVYDYYKPEYQVSEVYTLPSPTECTDKD